jgi:prepilin-type N-terminal cleavage/methylation domain-containing protein
MARRNFQGRFGVRSSMFGVGRFRQSPGRGRSLPGRRRGFTLMELVVVLLLFTLIGVMAGRFVGPVISVLRKAPMEAATNARFDNAMSALRADVWQSTAIESSSDSRLVLTQPDRTRVTWEFGPDRHLRQTGSAAGGADWGVLPTPIHFTPDGAAVHVRVAGDGHFHGGTFCMASAVLLEKAP